VIVSLVVTIALIGGSAAVSVLVPDKLRRSESGGR
jgi:hypothetical protein